MIVEDGIKITINLGLVLVMTMSGAGNAKTTAPTSQPRCPVWREGGRGCLSHFNLYIGRRIRKGCHLVKMNGKEAR